MAIWVNADEMVERLKWDFNEEYAKSILDDVTSFCADMVEVVRCKDCVYYREEDLCSYGERKDNG